MRGFGIVLVALGCIGCAISLAMSTSVDSPLGPVVNLDLMNRQHTYLIVSGVIAIVGIILLVIPSSPRLVDPFDEADRRSEIERKNYAVALGVTRQAGSYFVGDTAYPDLEAAISGAEGLRAASGLSPAQQAAKLEADRSASIVVDRVIIIAGLSLLSVLAIAFIVAW